MEKHSEILPAECSRVSLPTWASGQTMGVCLLLLAAPFSRTVAGPLEELHGASGLNTVNQAGLLRGEIFSDRGTQGSFPRGAYAESCYYIKAPVVVVGALQMHEEPPAKPREGVIYQTHSWPAPPDLFRKFQLSALRPADRKLLDWTVAVGRGEKDVLHLDAGEEETVRRELAGSGAKDVLASIAWQRILQKRNDAVAGGGLASMPAYQAGGATIRAADEYRSLLKMTPAIAAKFAGLTGAKPFFADGAQTADETVPYAEQGDVNGHTSFTLGALAARKSPDSWQVVDCTYYAADTYFVSLSLYQFWTWEGGTLVWEIDYIAAPFRSYLRGVDRLFAGKELSKESVRGSHGFRRRAEAKAR